MIFSVVSSALPHRPQSQETVFTTNESRNVTIISHNLKMWPKLNSSFNSKSRRLQQQEDHFYMHCFHIQALFTAGLMLCPYFIHIQTEHSVLTRGFIYYKKFNYMNHLITHGIT